MTKPTTTLSSVRERQQKMVEELEDKLDRIDGLEKRRKNVARRTLSLVQSSVDDKDTEVALSLLIDKETAELGLLLRTAVKLGMSVKHFLDTYYP